MKERLEYLELIGIGERTGIFNANEELLDVTKEDVLKFGAAVRDVCIEASKPKDLNDEKIAEIWHEAGGHMYKFAKLLRAYLCHP